MKTQIYVFPISVKNTAHTENKVSRMKLILADEMKWHIRMDLWAHACLPSLIISSFLSTWHNSKLTNANGFKEHTCIVRQHISAHVWCWQCVDPTPNTHPPKGISNTLALPTRPSKIVSQRLLRSFRAYKENVCQSTQPPDDCSLLKWVTFLSMFLFNSDDIPHVWVYDPSKHNCCHTSCSVSSLSWESWSIRSPDTRKIASSNLAESILLDLDFFAGQSAHPTLGACHIAGLLVQPSGLQKRTTPLPI